jgi:hypothetical protein
MLNNSPEDHLGVIRLLLADGPVPAKEFHRQVREHCLPVHDVYALLRQAGAKCRRIGSIGAGGYWVWELNRPRNFGIITRKDRKGYYARFWDRQRGKEVQKKLADDLETAKRRLADIMQDGEPSPFS